MCSWPDGWEGPLTEYYKCGGPVVPDVTKVLIAMGVLPSSTNASVRLALKGINVYATFRDTLHENVRFFEERGQHSGGSRAFLIGRRDEEQRASQDAQGDAGPAEAKAALADGADISALITTMHSAGFD